MSIMRKQFLWMFAAILTLCGASVLTTSCGDDDDEAKVDPAQVVGQWYAETAMNGEAQALYPKSSDEPVTFNKVSVEVNFLPDGKGTWAVYYLNGDQLVNADGYFYSNFNYTVADDGTITINHTGVAYSNVLVSFSFADGSIHGNINFNATVPFSSDYVLKLSFAPITAQQQAILNTFHDIMKAFHAAGDTTYSIKEIYEMVFNVKQWFGYAVAEEFAKSFVAEGYNIFIRPEGIYFGGHLESPNTYTTYVVDWEYFIEKWSGE